MKAHGMAEERASWAATSSCNIEYSSIIKNAVTNVTSQWSEWVITDSYENRYGHKFHYVTLIVLAPFGEEPSDSTVRNPFYIHLRKAVWLQKIRQYTRKIASKWIFRFWEMTSKSSFFIRNGNLIKLNVKKLSEVYRHFHGRKLWDFVHSQVQR